jgi:hypothetical protein
VEIGIFTTAFRKVGEEDFSNVAPGQTLALDLNDRMGKSLANGLYYLFIRAQGHLWKVKLLLLR